MTKVSTLTLSLLLTVAAVASAGKVSTGLERQLAAMDGDDTVRVLVVLSDQADVRGLDLDLHAAKAGRAERHRAVVQTLRSVAERSQAALLTDLEDSKAQGVVRGYTPHWLLNAVVVVTTADGVAELAARPDVEVVEADLRAELIEPLPSGKSGARSDIGITPGVIAVGARRVWDELGIDGAGTLVGVLDTGVQGDHPALSARWRGNHAPAEHCWLDAAGEGAPLPADPHFHGTHVMGTITGLAPNDTIGVAPGAEWIASNAIFMDSGAAFDNAVLASLEFMADPDGDPHTTDDVPDVVQNSWGVSEDFSGYVDCDSRWWDAIDAVEAAGVVLTWSAGNEGSGSGTVRSPADRTTTALNAFSVGSTLPTAPYAVSDFSSRGPSGCGGEHAVKPEIVAPGSDIYSALPDGGYGHKSGTSMAGPHVAGVVALMRAADPDLDVRTIKQILIDTAADLGAAGEDNDSGHGMVDAYAAVRAVLDGYGTLRGTVRDAGTGLPLGNVSVVVTAAGEPPRSTRTGADGTFDVMLPRGTWELAFSAFGYLAGTSSATVAAHAATDLSLTLTAAPTAVLGGRVTDAAGLPLGGSEVSAPDTPLPSVFTDAAGAYALALPLGASYAIRARADGHGGLQETIDFTGAATLDFQLPDQVIDGFESGGLVGFPWRTGGAAGWAAGGDDAFQGAFCARSGPVAHGETSALELEIDVLAPGPLEFECRVSSEADYDFLLLSIDGEEVGRWSGETGWIHVVHPLEPGPRSLRWEYVKDGLVSAGQDAAWLDAVILPVVAPFPYPAAAAGPAGLIQDLVAGETSTLTLTVTNTGDADLIVSAAAVMDRASAAPTTGCADLPKGAADDRPGRKSTRGSGGPDGFGYTWTDTDHPGGPAFDWVDIRDVGAAHAFDDDETRTFTLPFAFPFYGSEHTAVDVCSNGWVAFGTSSHAYNNDPIPTTDDPNALIAVFWDDLSPDQGGSIFTLADPERFIVQWDAVPYFGAEDPLTFQAILGLDGSILCQYLTVADRGSATIGLENPGGGDGLEVAFNGAYARDGLALRFARGPLPTPWLTVPAGPTTVAPGVSHDLPITLDAADLDAGTVTGSVVLTTNDPEAPLLVVPVELTVSVVTGIENGPPSRPSLDAAYPNPFNPSTTLSFGIPVGGAEARLEVFDVSGRLVRTLASGRLGAGRHTAVWRGEHHDGRRAASGTYFVRLRSGGMAETRAVVLVK